MKTKIDITTTVSLDEITRQLQENLSTNELTKFVINLADNLTEGREFLLNLRNKLNKIDFGE